MDVKIIVATHKKYQMPEDSLYLAVQVGAAGKDDLGYQRDDRGENISLMNPYYCELTGLYWAWKNLKADYIGLAHYRRHFTLSKRVPKSEEKKFKILLTKKEAEGLLKDCGIILPKKRNYFIESIYSHYKHTMYIEPLDITGNIIKEKYPEYYGQFENLKKTKKMHAFNMFIMKKDLLDKYCSWLFDILGQLEEKVDYKKYDSFHARFFGRISERLLDVWIKTNGLSYKEIPVIDMQKINWAKKILSFLKAKFTGKKYEKSF